MGLTLTYDNLAKQDGIGAQLQRIFGIYSISKKFHLGYLHSPIIETAEELAHNVSSDQELKKLLEQINTTFNFPSHSSVNFDEEIFIHNLNVKILFEVYLRSLITKRNILLRVCLPFGVIDKHPNWYEYAGSYLRSTLPITRPQKLKQVVVHVRHGYKPIVGKNDSSAPRFLPLTYYSDALKNILKMQNLDINNEIVVHTDIPDKSGHWKPFQDSKLSELASIGYQIDKNTLAFKGIDLRNNYFSDFPNLTVKYCAPILETLYDMMNADVLLMSRSSFSYISGIVNEKSVYIPRSHGHAKMSRWKWDYSKRKSPTLELLSGI